MRPPSVGNREFAWEVAVESEVDQIKNGMGSLINILVLYFFLPRKAWLKFFLKCVYSNTHPYSYAILETIHVCVRCCCSIRIDLEPLAILRVHARETSMDAFVNATVTQHNGDKNNFDVCSILFFPCSSPFFSTTFIFLPLLGLSA